ncbi:MAG: alkaline phosphatase family protein [Acidimicrobiales bacterium]
MRHLHHLRPNPPCCLPSICTARHQRRGPFLLLVAVAVVAAACSSSTSAPGTNTHASPTTTAAGGAHFRLPPIRHVFLIVLENQGYDATFGHPSSDSYLASTLPSEGALLSNYYATGHYSNDNYIALISGQAPNPANQTDCPIFSPFPASATLASDGQLSGTGCVYPTTVGNLGSQLTGAGLTWKAYMQDMGNIPSRESAVCGHPAVGAKDNTQTAVPGDGYATRHDPFVYFKSIIGNSSLCDSHVVPLGSTTGALPAGTPTGTSGLATDLRTVSTTPNFSFITPNLCYDGHDAPCPNQQASPSALVNIDTFLRTWVPRITRSPAFRQNGLLEVTFDESAGSGNNPVDTAACCNEVPGPSAPLPGITGPGGGRIGAVLISPFIRGGTKSAVPYNHYSTLATVEELFGLPKLGEARTVSATFGPDVFTKAG